MSVIDADGHITETEADLRAYLPAAYRQRPRLLPHDCWDRDFGGRLGKPRVDAAGQLHDMDREGIDVQVVYPSSTLGIGVLHEAGWPEIIARAYNDWLHAFCQTDPARLKGVAQLPLQDPPAAAGELRRAVTELGHVGAMISTYVYPGRDLGHPDLDPVYAAAEALDVPLAVHITTGLGSLASERFDNFLSLHATTPVFELVTAFVQIVLGGVFERFPRLRLAFLEGGVGWLPYWLERLDEEWAKRQSEAPRISAPPSSYAKSGRCYFSFEPDERLLPLVVEDLGDRVLLYASDYPHWDCGFPDTVRTVRARTDLSEATKARLLGQNAAEFYRLPVPTVA